MGVTAWLEKTVRIPSLKYMPISESRVDSPGTSARGAGQGAKDPIKIVEQAALPASGATL
jgi:hypothetical protein